jgi:hypothetical protein
MINAKSDAGEDVESSFKLCGEFSNGSRRGGALTADITSTTYSDGAVVD